MSGLFNAIDVSASGMTLQRRKMDVVAQNIANVETTRTEQGGPYRRRRIVVSESKESVPFRTLMTKASSRLACTNGRHISGGGILSRDNVEISRAQSREIEDPASSFRLVHDPDHPDADDEGMVHMPDIEIVNEMVDMMSASRAYEANTTVVLASKEMARNALDI